MRTGWSNLRNKLFIMLFEQIKQHLWHSCCQISLVISNMKFNRKLSEQFWRSWCFPIQSDRSCTWMPERRFKDGRRVTGLVLKRLCLYSVSISTMYLGPRKGCAILTKNYISIYFGIFSITIIRRYFAKCVIVLISDYHGHLQFLIFFIFCVVSSHQW